MLRVGSVVLVFFFFFGYAMRYTRATLVLKLLPNCYTETSRRELHYSVVYVRRYLSCGELHRFVWEGEDPRNAVRAGLVWWSLAQFFFFFT